MPRALLFLYAESPVHAGADSSVGVVDLPIQREASTGLPVIWGQSLKGALREHAARSWQPDLVEAVFGSAAPSPGSLNDGLRPGSLAVGDAQLVAFPAPTLLRTFAWVTSPLVLGRMARKAVLAAAALPGATALPQAQQGGAGLAAHQAWASDSTVLGPYVLPCRQDGAATAWADWLAGIALPSRGVPPYFAGKLRDDLLTVADELLEGISKECTEVAARVQLGKPDPKTGRPTKTVAHGPFYSEALPTESLLAALLDCANREHLRELVELLDNEILRIGGDETIGKGLMWCRFAGGQE